MSCKQGSARDLKVIRVGTTTGVGMTSARQPQAGLAKSKPWTSARAHHGVTCIRGTWQVLCRTSDGHF